MLGVSEEDKLAVVAHGFGGTYLAPWWDVVEQQLASWGYSVLKVDFDGFGRTVGSPEEYAARMAEELEDTYGERLAEGYFDTVVGFGHSMGGIITRYCAENQGYEEFFDKIVTVGTPHEGTEIADPLAWLGIEGAESLSPESAILKELNEGGVSSETAYLSICGAADPALWDNGNARLDDDDAVYVEPGTDPYSLALEQLNNLSSTGSDIAQDLARDLGDLAETGLSVLSPCRTPEPEKMRLRSLDPRLVGLRMQQLRADLEPESEELLAGHVSVLYNESMWEEIADFLDEDPPEAVGPFSDNIPFWS